MAVMAGMAGFPSESRSRVILGSCARLNCLHLRASIGWSHRMVQNGPKWDDDVQLLLFCFTMGVSEAHAFTDLDQGGRFFWWK